MAGSSTSDGKQQLKGWFLASKVWPVGEQLTHISLLASITLIWGIVCASLLRQLEACENHPCTVSSATWLAGKSPIQFGGRWNTNFMCPNLGSQLRLSAPAMLRSYADLDFGTTKESCSFSSTQNWNFRGPADIQTWNLRPVSFFPRKPLDREGKKCDSGAPASYITKIGYII